MIQIGIEPPAALRAPIGAAVDAALGETPPATPDAAMLAHPAPQTRSDGDRPAEAGDGILFVSPPPLPFPRVFPGL